MGGLPALKSQIGDYGIPYQTIIALLSLMRFNPILMYKAVSILFDFILAALTALVVYRFSRKTSYIAPYVAAYGLVLLSPLTVWNSSVWGQCDSMYVAFCVAAILLYEHKHPYGAFIAFGFAFAFKLQAVFLMPYLGYKILSEDKWHRLFGLLLIPFPLFLLSIPAIAFGRPISGILGGYLHQLSEYKVMYANAPSFWAFGANLSFSKQEGYWQSANKYAVLLTFVVLLLILIMGLCFNKRRHVDHAPLMIAYIFAHTCVFFLPSMHERYGFLAEILIIALTVLDIDFLPSAVFLYAASIMSYGNALFGGGVNPILVSTLSGLSLCYAFYIYARRYGYSLFHIRRDLGSDKGSMTDSTVVEQITENRNRK